MVPSISIVIPAYNEAARLSRSLGRMASFLRTYQTAELLVVDDGSSDGTAEVAERYLSEDCSVEWRVLRLPTNRGKGCAVRHGLLAARAPVALFSDADLSTPITELPKLVDLIYNGSCDVAFGSRALDRRLIETRQPFYRDRAGRAFNAALRLATGLPFHDTQCGFKAFRMAVCRRTPRVRHDRWVRLRCRTVVRGASRRPQAAGSSGAMAARGGQQGAPVARRSANAGRHRHRAAADVGRSLQFRDARGDGVCAERSPCNPLSVVTSSNGRPTAISP